MCNGRSEADLVEWNSAKAVKERWKRNEINKTKMKRQTNPYQSREWIRSFALNICAPSLIDCRAVGCVCDGEVKKKKKEEGKRKHQVFDGTSREALLSPEESSNLNTLRGQPIRCTNRLSVFNQMQPRRLLNSLRRCQDKVNYWKRFFFVDFAFSGGVFRGECFSAIPLHSVYANASSGT